MPLSDDLIQEVGGIGQNQAHLRQLLDQLHTPLGVVPFVGAGLSVPFGFPVWSAFLLETARIIDCKDKIRIRLDAGQYEEAAEDLLREMSPTAFNTALDEAYGDHRLVGPSFVDHAIAVLLRELAEEESRHSQPPLSPVDPRKLRKVLITKFTLEPLSILCADVQHLLANDGISLPVSLDLVGGVSQEAKALNLITYLDHRGHIRYLDAAVRQARPNAI